MIDKTSPWFSMTKDKPQAPKGAGLPARIRKKCIYLYVMQSGRIWRSLSPKLRERPIGQRYGRHLHSMVLLQANRHQYFGTFFLRNRAELDLMRHLIRQFKPGSKVDVCILACSKGAEVYSIHWALKSARPDLKIAVHASDIAQDIVDFAREGVYSRVPEVDVKAQESGDKDDVKFNTRRHQNAPIFERMTEEEINAMCDVDGDDVRIKPWLKEGIDWQQDDAFDPSLPDRLGLQDIVVANRFLCHMPPAQAEKCLRNVARLVKPGGYLFVTGIDLDVRTKVARALGWKPVPDLKKEIHEGDISLRLGWPLEYWGVEGFSTDRPDWEIRYASVFQIGEPA